MERAFGNSVLIYKGLYRIRVQQSAWSMDDPVLSLTDDIDAIEFAENFHVLESLSLQHECISFNK